MKFEEFQEEVGDWAYENFGTGEEYSQRIREAENSDALMPLLGMQEELGELVHSVSKQIDGIKLDSEKVGREAEKDAVGDLMIFIAHFCERRGLDLEDCVETAWKGEVEGRDWTNRD